MFPLHSYKSKIFIKVGQQKSFRQYSSLKIARGEFHDCWVKDELCIDRVKSSSTKKDTGREYLHATRNTRQPVAAASYQPDDKYRFAYESVSYKSVRSLVTLRLN